MATASASHSTGRRGLTPDGPIWVLLGAIALTVGVRLVMLLTNIAGWDADEAVTGVMTQRILDGDFPLYFGIQSYQGALEQYLQAPFLAVLPDTPLTLRILPLILTAVVCVLVYVLGTRIVGSRWAGALAAVLYAIGPYWGVWKSIKSHGGYNGAVIFGMLAILMALMLRRESPRSGWIAAALGVFAGLAIWENYLAFYLLIPAALWALGSARGALGRLMAWASGGFIVGILPIILFRAIHGINPPSGTGTPPPTGIWERMDLLLSPVLGQFLGIRTGGPAITRWVPPALVTMLALAALGAALWARRTGLWDLLTARTRHRAPIDIVLLAFAITPFIYASSTYTWYSGEPRYLYTLYPLLAIALAAAVFALRGRTRWVLAALLIVGSGTILARTMVVVHDAGGSVAVADGGVVANDDLPAVSSFLGERGITSAYADYWVAYPLQYAGEGAVSVTPYSNSHFPALDAQVRRDPRPAIVSVTGPGADAMRAQLRDSGRRFTETAIGGFTVFTAVTPVRRPPAP